MSRGLGDVYKRQVFTNTQRVESAIHDGLLEKDVVLEDGCYIESSWLAGSTVVKRGAIVSQMILQDMTVPEDTVWHGIRLKEQNAYLVRTYAVTDNPKKTLEENAGFLQGTLQTFLEDNGLCTDDLWDTQDHSLWNAKLYSAHPAQDQAAEEALLLWKMSCKEADEEEVCAWKARKRYSLCESFAQGDTSHFVEWNEELENRILIERFLKALKGGENYIAALKIFGEEELNEKQYEILMEKADHMEFSEKIRVLYAISRSMKYQSVTFHGASYDLVEQKCFSEIQKMLFQKSFIRHAADYKICLLYTSPSPRDTR